MEIEIKTSLFFLYGEQQAELKTRIPNVLGKFLAKGYKKNLPEILMLLIKKKVDIKISRDFEELPKKHSKTFLLYVSDKEHAELIDYLNTFISAGDSDVRKKQIRTEVVIELLKKIK
jgi:hypothetical protein